jgi:Family of unknown function (DUF5683)
MRRFSATGPTVTRFARLPRVVMLSTVAVTVLVVPGRAGAQKLPEPTAPPISAPDTARRDTTHVHRGVSPRGAFLRAIVIPGWGHSAIGSYRRGAFYFVTEGITAWGLIKTHERIKEVQGRISFAEGVVRSDLAAQGVTDPDSIRMQLDSAATLVDLRGLEKSRKSQREDWTALAIFLVLLSGADAYVSAHLQHFPAPMTLDAQPAGDGRMDVSLGLKLPR